MCLLQVAFPSLRKDDALIAWNEKFAKVRKRRRRHTAPPLPATLRRARPLFRPCALHLPFPT
jgi:hypothetical protein